MITPDGPAEPTSDRCPGSPPPAVKLTQIADGLTGPTYVTQAPGDPTRLYVLEQQGTVRVIENGMLKPTPAIDLRTLSAGRADSTPANPLGGYSEAGLLGMVFHPEFETNGRLFLGYTTSPMQFIVAEFKMSDPDTIDPGSFSELAAWRQYPFAPGSGTNHIGGMLAFSPKDGYLYVSRGDGGNEYDRQMSGQDNSDDLCSLLRIDPDTYPTPVEGNLQGHVWNYGFRNPWRFSFDRETGDIYIGDVGQDIGSGYEEINVEPAGVSGRNYGWRATNILDAPYQGPCSGDCGGTSGPAVAYPVRATANAVIGGYVYRGSRIPNMVGRYVYTDWSERVLKTFVYKGDDNGQPEVCDEHDTNVMVPMKVRSFGEGLDGELYVVGAGAGEQTSISAEMDSTVHASGTVFRIDPM